MNKSQGGLTTVLAISAGAILVYVGVKALGLMVAAIVVILCIIGLAKKFR